MRNEARLLIPYDARQTFQIGDVCQIVGNPDDPYAGLFGVIIGSYWQLCGTPPISIAARDLQSYSVVFPENLNPSSYDDSGWFHAGGFHCKGEGGMTWVYESTLKFVREPTKIEKETAENKYWSHIDKYGRHFGWSDIQ